MKRLLTFHEFVNESLMNEGFKSNDVKRALDLINIKTYESRTNEAAGLSDGYDTSNISRDDLRKLHNYLENHDISYSQKGEELLFDMTELDQKGQEYFAKMGIKESVQESHEDFVEAKFKNNFETFKKGDVIKVNALQFTKSGDSDNISVIDTKGKKIDLKKVDLKSHTSF